jgi:hypothetical protein
MTNWKENMQSRRFSQLKEADIATPDCVKFFSDSLGTS